MAAGERGRHRSTAQHARSLQGRGGARPNNDDGLIDHSTFDQLLEMDDDDRREFSWGIVAKYIEQIETTFIEMETALRDRDLASLSSRGHFLKGSSAALGLRYMRTSCELIQNYGAMLDETGTRSIDPETALERIATQLEECRRHAQRAEQYFRTFYNK